MTRQDYVTNIDKEFKNISLYEDMVNGYWEILKAYKKLGLDERTYIGVANLSPSMLENNIEELTELIQLTLNEIESYVNHLIELNGYSIKEDLEEFTLNPHSSVDNATLTVKFNFYAIFGIEELRTNINIY